MRYLDKRADFLSQRQHIITEEVKPIYESQSGAGPFANDVGWNDSLLGRLINHMIRKARIAAKVPRIKTLIERLNAAFEELVGQSIVFSCSQETQSSITNVQIVSIYYELIFAVESGESVLVLKSLTDDAISNTEASNFEKKDILLEELKKFREFLNQFDDSVGSSSDDEESSDSSGSGSDSGSGSQYVTMIKNLKALSLIIANYKKVNLGVTTQSKMVKLEKDKEYLLDSSVVKLVDTKNIGTPDQPKVTVIFRDKNTKTYKPNSKPTVVYAAKLKELTKESAEIRTNNYGNTNSANIDRNNVTGAEDHLTQAFTKLRKDIEVLISAKEKGVGIDYNFISDILANSKDTKNKNLVKSLYHEVNRYLVGDKKGTLQDKNTLYKEGVGIDTLSNKNKIVIVAEKIARLVKRAMQFDKENLYGGLGDLKAPLKEFVDTIKIIMKYKIEVVKESNGVLTYSSFLEAKNILSNDKVSTQDDNNATETNDQEAQGEEKSKDSEKSGKLSADSEKILVFFNKTCIEVRKFTITDETRESAKKEFEEKSKDYKPVMTMDPIIEIMKIFIKAYKLYTVRTITKRSENVDTNTLSEYTPLGSADDSGRKGPYRNNKLFDMWEDAVNDIRKNRKYQVFFTKNAGLRLPKVADPNPNDPNDWEIKDNAGTSFNTFINDVLDGDELYKKENTQGSVAKFVEKYFGDGSTTQAQQKDLNSTKPDLEDATDLNNQIQAGAIDLIFKQSDKTGGEYINTFFAIDYDNIDDNGATTKGGKYFFYVSDGFNLIFNAGFDMFSNFLVGPKRNIDKGDLNDLGSRSDFRYTLLTKKEDIAAGSNLKFEYSVFNKESIKETKKIKVKKVYRLVYKNDDGKLYRLEGDALTRWYKDLGRRNYIAPPTAAGVKAKVDKSNPKITKI